MSARSALGVLAAQGSGVRRTARLVVGVAVALLAVTCLVGGGWALWLDQVDRDASGFLSVASTDNVHTATYALVSPLRGDGPTWLYGQTVLGTARVRSTSLTGHAEFVGIARTSAVDSYLNGVGVATIDHLATGAVTTRPGHAPTRPPGQVPIWAASTKGTGTHTLVWSPRPGAWSIVVMNAGAGAGVAVRGDVAAKVPLLPWVGIVLCVTAVVLGLLALWMVVGARRPRKRGVPEHDEQSAPTPEAKPAGAAV